MSLDSHSRGGFRANLMSAARGSMQRPYLHIINHLEISNDGPPRESLAYLINSEGILEHGEIFQNNFYPPNHE